jgi:hypothetical protein
MKESFFGRDGWVARKMREMNKFSNEWIWNS